jgi:hypothetical protein
MGFLLGDWKTERLSDAESKRLRAEDRSHGQQQAE